MKEQTKKKLKKNKKGSLEKSIGKAEKKVK